MHSPVLRDLFFITLLLFRTAYYNCNGRPPVLRPYFVKFGSSPKRDLIAHAYYGIRDDSYGELADEIIVTFCVLL